MYSLYRAWLMHHQDAFNSTIGSTPPDVLLQVGPTGTQFTAHRALLIAHSGYFKSVLVSGSTATTQQSPIIVANVGVNEFTSLLTWMYTGFLDLNLENIYNILLATHLLHMPNALEICRNFLIQNNHLLQHPAATSAVSENRRLIGEQPIFQSTSSSNIIKPIPSRKFLPNTFRFEPILPATSIQLNENTSFHKIDSLNKKTSEQIRQLDDDRDEENSQHSNNSVSTASSEKIIEIVQVTSPKPSTSYRRSPTPHQKRPKQLNVTTVDERSLSPNLIEKNIVDDDAVIQYTTTKKLTKRIKKSIQNSTDNCGGDNNSKVIIDIACCDGPVRFHRVLNNCYGLANNESVQISKNFHLDKSNKTDIMNKIMTANINMKKMHNKNEENSPNIAVDSGGVAIAGGGNDQNDSGVIYTCVYCNHTFKSQYCYQKHARRHINPITLNSTCKIILSNDNSTEHDNNSPGDQPLEVRAPGNHGGGSGANISSKREVKLLDMNVQYYPCKTCGSKFPSYYFVHKHRKMYHADEMANEKEAENVGNEKKSPTGTPVSKENDG